MLLATIVALVILALIAVKMLLLFVSVRLLAYTDVLLLGFGGSRWTAGIAITRYKTVLGICLQLFTTTFLVGAGKPFLGQYYNAFESCTPDFSSLCVLVVAAVVLLSLVDKLPLIMAGIVGTGVQFSGIASFGALLR